MKKNRIEIGVMIVLLCALLFAPLRIDAAGEVETNRPVKLTIYCLDQEKPLTAFTFSLYQIATLKPSGEAAVTEAFLEYPVDIRGKNDEAWKNLALTLEGYVLKNGVAPQYSGSTDSFGKLVFDGSAGSLEQGLYLVLGDKHEQDGWCYDFTPFIVSLPMTDKESNEWNYEMEIYPKFESLEKEERISLYVLKVWKDDGFEKERPAEIKIQLLKNGTVFDTVTLTKKNNWKYGWKELSGNERWTVTEADPEGYYVEVEKEGNTFIVTNTYDVPEIVPEEPGEPKLPQTGQLWWPVPILIAAGLLCMIIGLLRRRAEDKK